MSVPLTEGAKLPLQLARGWRSNGVVVLDNFEQLVAAAPVLADLLAAAPNVTCLVTRAIRCKCRPNGSCPLAG
ncbi:MAG: hypothetical protein R2856_38935 [Caldilineaceae bacterium]